MIQWLVRKARREAAQLLLSELFFYNQRDFCYDARGSFDVNAVRVLIEQISRGELKSSDLRENMARLKPLDKNSLRLLREKKQQHIIQARRKRV